MVAAFGDEILLENGEVNRPMLGQIVFSDPDKRQFLNRYSIFFLFFLDAISEHFCICGLSKAAFFSNIFGFLCVPRS